MSVISPLSNPKGVKLNCELCGRPAYIQCKNCKVTFYWYERIWVPVIFDQTSISSTYCQWPPWNQIQHNLHPYHTYIKWQNTRIPGLSRNPWSYLSIDGSASSQSRNPRYWRRAGTSRKAGQESAGITSSIYKIILLITRLNCWISVKRRLTRNCTWNSTTWPFRPPFRHFGFPWTFTERTALS